MTEEQTKSIDEQATMVGADALEPEYEGTNTSAESEQQEAQAVKEAAFSEIKAEEGNASSQRNLDFLLDISLEVTVELGRTKIMIADLLRLSQGSVVELAKAAGEPLDILVNQKLMARGEVVVVNDKLGIRLADIISPAERVKRLA